MTEDQRRNLHAQLWKVADEFFGKMNADDYRDYMLGLIFYKYLSEKISLYADELLRPDELTFADIANHPQKRDYLAAVKKATLDKLGYFLLPEDLFDTVAKNAANDDKLTENLERILHSIEKSTMGNESEEDFGNLFSGLNLHDIKLGKTVADRNKLIARVLGHLDKIDFHLEDSQIDILGDAYEYLIAKFAAGAGKKAGEFYTPQEVSEILARIVTHGKTHLRDVYDPTR